MERIVIDTAQLGTSIEALQQQLNQLRAGIKTLYGEAQELNAMWSGPANQAFTVQFANDQNTLTEICNGLAAYLQDLATARAEYDRCDQLVGELVAAIQV